MIFEHVQPLQVLLIIQFKHEGFDVDGTFG